MLIRANIQARLGVLQGLTDQRIAANQKRLSTAISARYSLSRSLTDPQRYAMEKTPPLSAIFGEINKLLRF
jgi:hypothetical protein